MFEFAKGILFLLFGLGALSFVHSDVADAASKLILHLHLDPAWHYSKMLIEESSKLTVSQVRHLGLFALFFSVVRFVESFGLWHEKQWAEWFAVISAALYMPLEIHHLIKHFLDTREVSWTGVIILGVNLAIVIYLWLLLAEEYRKRAAKKLAKQPPL